MGRLTGCHLVWLWTAELTTTSSDTSWEAMYVENCAHHLCSLLKWRLVLFRLAARFQEAHAVIRAHLQVTASLQKEQMRSVFSKMPVNLHACCVGGDAGQPAPPTGPAPSKGGQAGQPRNAKDGENKTCRLCQTSFELSKFGNKRFCTVCIRNYEAAERRRCDGPKSKNRGQCGRRSQMTLSSFESTWLPSKKQSDLRKDQDSSGEACSLQRVAGNEGNPPRRPKSCF